MPVYVYQCDTCGMTFERRQSITEEPLHDCPECEGHVHRVIQPVGVIFKGSGFYVTDNRAHSPISTRGNEKSAKPNGTESTSDADTESNETKPTSDASTEATESQEPTAETSP
jgi:putative FmdB family regulatory protein